MIEYSWPRDILPNEVSFQCVSHNLYSSNPVRRTRRGLGTTVSQWVVKASFGPYSADKWMAAQALITLVEGADNVIRFWDPSRPYPYGAAAGLNMTTAFQATLGEPFSDGTYFSDGSGWSELSGLGAVGAAAPSGVSTVLVEGLVPGQALSLVAGDLLEIGGYLYQAVLSVSSDANGKALVPIRPRLRSAVLPGDPVNFDHPTSPFQLVDDDQGEMSIQVGLVTQFGLNLIEVLPSP